MARVVAIVREHGATAGLVLRKAAGRQHNAAAGDDFDLAVLGADDRAGYRTIDTHKPLDRCIGPDLGAKIQGRAKQPGCQRIAIGQQHAAAVEGEVAGVACEAFGDIGGGGDRARHVEEVLQLRS